MISKEEFIMIHELRKKGYSMCEIAKITRLDRKTVRKRLKEAKLMSIIRTTQRLSKLEPYKDFIVS